MTKASGCCISIPAQQVRTLVRLTIDGIDIRDLQVIELGKKII